MQEQTAKNTILTRPHITKKGTYVPDLGILYPQEPNQHMLEFTKLRDINFDAGYPYVDKSFKARLQSFLIYLGIFTLVFFLHPFCFGLKIKGKKNLKGYKKAFRNGAMTISNHVYRWDFLAIVQALHRRLWVPAKKENICGKDGFLIRSVGGIPIPFGASAMKAFNTALEELHKKKQWFHFFPESSSWPYYEPIRPFFKGAFSIAYNFDLPIIPMAFSYRKPKGLLKLFLKDKPAITLNIGCPLFFDKSLAPRMSQRKMLEVCHAKIVDLAGIQQNMWPACAI